MIYSIRTLDATGRKETEFFEATNDTVAKMIAKERFGYADGCLLKNEFNNKTIVNFNNDPWRIHGEL